MKTIRTISWALSVFPLIFFITVMSIPFYLLCIFYGLGDQMDLIATALGLKIKQSLINFVGEE